MKKSLMFYLLLIISGNSAICQNLPKNSLGISLGVTPSINDMYFGEPWDFYPNREISPVYNVFYMHRLITFVRAGIYAEHEKVRFSDQSGANLHSFRRNNIGLIVIAHFPEKPFHLQIGGYLGYGYLRADNWTDLYGFDAGGLFGPAYEKNKLGIALHIQSGYGGYTSDGTPEEVKLYNPRLLLKGYLRF